MDILETLKKWSEDSRESEKLVHVSNFILAPSSSDIFRLKIGLYICGAFDTHKYFFGTLETCFRDATKWIEEETEKIRLLLGEINEVSG